MSKQGSAIALRRGSILRGSILRAIACSLALAGAAVALAHSPAAAQNSPAPKAPARPTAPTVAPVHKPQAPQAQTPAAAATTTPNEAKPGEGKPDAKPVAAPNPAPVPAGGWIARCVSESRQSPVECSMEETVVLTSTGQLLASMLVRVPADTRAPVMIFQVPNGLFLPAGLNLQIDDGKPQGVPLQTCDPKGCYSAMPLPAELLASLKSGKRLTITYQNMAKNNVTVPLALDNFAEAYQKIQ